MAEAEQVKAASDPLVAFRSGRAARTPIMGPNRLMRSTRSIAAHSGSSTGAWRMTPALLKRRSSRPPAAAPNASTAAP